MKQEESRPLDLKWEPNKQVGHNTNTCQYFTWQWHAYFFSNIYTKELFSAPIPAPQGIAMWVPPFTNKNGWLSTNLILATGGSCL